MPPLKPDLVSPSPGPTNRVTRSEWAGRLPLTRSGQAAFLLAQCARANKAAAAATARREAEAEAVGRLEGELEAARRQAEAARRQAAQQLQHLEAERGRRQRAEGSLEGAGRALGELRAEVLWLLLHFGGVLLQLLRLGVGRCTVGTCCVARAATAP